MLTRITAALAARKNALKDKDEKGFTLIELLVVVIIIGVLAAIAIPIYIGVQENAKDSAVKSDLTNAKIAVTAYYTENSVLPDFSTNAAELKEFGLTQSDNTGDFSFGGGGTPTAESFCIQSQRKGKSGTDGIFHIGSSGGVEKDGC